jgi:radical SAM protein with 4Fe4S-binding SPASM domain
VRFGGIPLCVLGKRNYVYAYEVYEPEMRIGTVFKRNNTMCLWNKEISVEKRSSNRTSKIIDMGRIKIEACKKCSLLAICGGVFEEYLAIYGDKGIITQ